MATRRPEITEEQRSKLLIWCERHCCFCGRQCTTNIEIHHIDQDSSNNQDDNLIPLCFDCHGELARYNPKHPRGTKYRYLEVSARREQIYEEYTRKYLRQVTISISRFLHFPGRESRERAWPDFSYTVTSLSGDIPIQIRSISKPYFNRNFIEQDLGDLYSGRQLWNLNPGQVVLGHFRLPIAKEDLNELRIEVHWKIVDVVAREHAMLPFSYVLTEENSDFWYDPCVVHSTGF